jgi:hypothetical protein
MKILVQLVTTIITASLLPNEASAVPDNETMLGRELIARHNRAVVNVEILVSMRLPSRGSDSPPREQKIDVNGTVLSPRGMIAIPLSAADPRPMIPAGGPSGPVTFEPPELTITAVRIRLPSAVEIPAMLVAKDVESGLAFIAPAEETVLNGYRFDFVELESWSDGNLLDTCILVGRTPPSQQSVPIVRSSQVIGVFEVPIKLYILPEQFTGGPAYAKDGKVLGITSTYQINHRPVAAVIVPAKEISKALLRIRAAQSTN